MKRIFAITFFSLLSLVLVSQNNQIENLRRQQKDLQEDIKQTNRLFLDVKKQTTTILQRINLINKQIASRKEMMELQNKEITALVAEQQRLDTEIKRLNVELEQKKESYAKAMRMGFANILSVPVHPA